MTNAVSKVPTSDPKDTDKKSDATASLSEVFMNAEPFDYLLMSLGILGGAVTGLSLPAMNIVFGRLLNTINGTVESLTEGIAKLCVIIVVIAGMNVFSGFLQVSQTTLRFQMIILLHRCTAGPKPVNAKPKSFARSM